MTVHLSKDLERFVREAVRAGLYPSGDDVISEALARLRQTMTQETATPGHKPIHDKPPQHIKQPLTPAELDEYMLKSGLMSQLPETAADFDDPDDEPITIKGEPLSETIIRERR